MSFSSAEDRQQILVMKLQEVISLSVNIIVQQLDVGS